MNEWINEWLYLSFSSAYFSNDDHSFDYFIDRA